MLTLSTTIFLSFSISVLVMLLALTVSEKSTKEREKMTPFECGFTPFKKARSPFSLRFFIVTLVFLIFDVEVALILPLGLVLKTTSLPLMLILAFSVLLILSLGLVHEWNQGALEWVS